MGDGAVLVVALAHGPSVAPGLAVVKNELAKNKETLLACKPYLLKRKENGRHGGF
jgi:hypothetical protein